ncbi:MAG: hypothetical protein HQK83_16960 [Fibrobacteria bacterium]|nr:hypothetical protein [Fibrobacteria bacterium]
MTNTDSFGKEFGEELKNAVKVQIRSNNPPEVKGTFNRLIEEGVVKSDIMKMLASAMAGEVYDMMKEKRKFQEENYIKYLHQLPTMPWDNKKTT